MSLWRTRRTRGLATESKSQLCLIAKSDNSQSKVSERMYETLDFNELLSKVSENIDIKEQQTEGKNFLHREMFRPEKTRKMLATRACRSSITVGKALNKRQMRQIAENLSGLECPWNCPHGRPTMRFLLKLDDIPNSFDEFGAPPKILKRC